MMAWASLSRRLSAVFAALLLVCTPLAFLGGCSKGADKWEGKYDAEAAAHKETRRANAVVLRELADASAAVAARAKAASSAYAAARAVNNRQYDKAVDDAKQARSDLVRAQRAGTVQLHDWWTCDRPGAGVGDAAGLSGGQDGHADLRAESAAEDVQAGAEADAWIGWLQRELIATRSAVFRAGCAVEAQP